MSNYCANDLAKYIIWQHKEAEKEITNLRLQKLLYYVQGYFLKNFDIPAFDEEIFRWAYGPVVVDVYYEYCSNGAGPLFPPARNEVERIERSISPQHIHLLSKILKATHDFSVGTLVNKTHSETPWIEAEDRGLITVESIKNYFTQNNPLHIF